MNMNGNNNVNALTPIAFFFAKISSRRLRRVFPMSNSAISIVKMNAVKIFNETFGKVFNGLRIGTDGTRVPFLKGQAPQQEVSKFMYNACWLRGFRFGAIIISRSRFEF